MSAFLSDIDSYRSPGSPTRVSWMKRTHSLIKLSPKPFPLTSSLKKMSSCEDFRNNPEVHRLQGEMTAAHFIRLEIGKNGDFSTKH